MNAELVPSGKPLAIVVGAGLMGRWHAAYLGRAGVKLAAVCDPDLEAARHVAARHGGVPVFPSLQSCLDEMQGATAVHVCIPASGHESTVTLALERGLHVLCEKPLAANAVVTEALLELADRHHRILCPTHQYVFQEGVRNLIDDLPGLGDLLQLNLRFVSAGAKGSAPTEMNSVIADILPHPLSLAWRIFGDDFRDADWKIVHHRAGEFHALTSIRGCALSIQVSMSGRPTLASLFLMGSRGTIHADLFHGFSFREGDAVSRWNKITRPFEFCLRNLTAATGNLGARAWRQEPAYPGLPTLIRCFYAAIAGQDESPLSAREVVGVARIRDRLVAEAGLI